MSNDILGTFHSFCNTKTQDGEIEKVYNSYTEGELISYLKKQENYLKVSDKKVSDKMNLIELKGTYKGNFIYPISSLKRDRVQSYRIDEVEDRYGRCEDASPHSSGKRVEGYSTGRVDPV